MIPDYDEKKSGKLRIYNTLKREKEAFEALNPPSVGLYVCGPTVYNYVHLGNCRTFTSFDFIYRYLTHLGYKVRYVRNITDVGHLVNDADEGEDKIAKEAKLRNLEPMEVVQKYTNHFHDIMKVLNNTPPSIEPTATGHLMEQIEIVEKIIANGYGYESEGSVYFDVEKFSEDYDYGQLSGRKIDDAMSGSRQLDGQQEKRSNVDFAIWKKADPSHIMRWKAPWSEGFPGWHLECTAMSTKYLGETFDIHGGGMDLQFPHHECEIAQSVGSCGKEPVRYWMHTNMLTVNNQRMGKSVGNAISPEELFSGNHELLDQAYSPMTLRFMMLQAHYRSTMDLSNDALKAAQSGYRKLMNAVRIAKNLTYTEDENAKINEKQVKHIESAVAGVYRSMNDDFNTAAALASLFNLAKKVNTMHLGQLKPSELGKETFDSLIRVLVTFAEDVFGLQEEQPDLSSLIDFLIENYKEAKAAGNYDRVDEIRSKALEVGIQLRDRKDAVDWAYTE